MIRKFKVNTLMTGRNNAEFIPIVIFDENKTEISRGSSEVERWTHNPDVGGAIPSPAPPNPNIVLGYN